MKILVVEDDISLQQVLRKRLVLSGFSVQTASDGLEALSLLKFEEFDLVISDIMMPNLNGYELLKAIRAKKIDVPVLFLSAKDRTDDIVKGLDLGADEYMVKPFEFSELLARIRLLSRRKMGAVGNAITVGDLTLNLDNRTAKRGDVEVELTAKEFELLKLLVSNKNRVLTRDQIASALYEYDYTESNSIDVYIRFLRKKLDDDFEEKLIHTVRGIGYMIK